MTDVFVSFCTRDDATATEVCNQVEAAGFKCWRCTRPEDNIAGTDWLRTLVDRLQEAEVVVLLHSSNAELSHYTFKEVRMAASLEKPMIVLQLEDMAMDASWAFLLRTMQMIPVKSLDRDEWSKRLVVAIKHLIRREVALPLDSIHNRRLKVDLCRDLFRCLGESWQQDPDRVLIGAGIRMVDVNDAYFSGAARFRAQVGAIERVLARVAGAEVGDEPWFCVPFWLAEDVFALLGWATTPSQRTRLEHVMASLAALLDSALADVSGASLKEGFLRAEVRIAPVLEWSFPNASEMTAELARYFTRLGSCDLGSPVKSAAPSEQSLVVPGARAQLTVLARRFIDGLSRNDSLSGVTHAMTVLRAESHLASLAKRR